MIYEMCKLVIEKRGFEPTEMTAKLDLFLSCGKITQQQYDELACLMGD